MRATGDDADGRGAARRVLQLAHHRCRMPVLTTTGETAMLYRE
jgi:hypothetical protein